MHTTSPCTTHGNPKCSQTAQTMSEFIYGSECVGWGRDSTTRSAFVCRPEANLASMYALTTVRRDFGGLIEKLSSPAGQRIGRLLTPDVPRRPTADDISFPTRRNHRLPFVVTTPAQVIARGAGLRAKISLEPIRVQFEFEDNCKSVRVLFDAQSGVSSTSSLSPG